MFGGVAKIRDLLQQLDELRNYCIKFTTDVNNFAASQTNAIEILKAQINKLTEEKQND